ncbi:hypothetical protein ACWDXD_25060 [Streptomyces sp. NPDC003314]
MSGTVAPARARTPRKPTGLPNPPIVLLAGPDLTGKSHEAAVGSGTDLVGTTYWVQVGGTSGTADYYGQLDGARYEIVPHDGSFDDIVDAIHFAVAQPPAEDGKRNMIVIDDVSAVWDLLSDEVAYVSRKRAERRALVSGAPGWRLDDPHEDDERDLWVSAKERWGRMLHVLRKHSGPTVLIARQEIVTAYEGDKPTGRTTLRIKAERNLRGAVDAVVEFRAVGEAYITGLHVMPKHGAVRPGWDRFDGVDSLLRRLGYQDAAMTRAAVESRPEAYLDQQLRTREQQGHGQESAHQCQPPGPSGPQLVHMVHQALTDQTDPEARLLDLRETWGTYFLKKVPVHTNMWGHMDADTLITRSLDHVKTKAEERQLKKAGNTTGQSEQSTEGQGDTGQPADAPAPAAEQVPAEETREHPEPSEPEAPAEEDAPPPPDPQAEEPPPVGETPEETSAAEEPQDPPTPPPAQTLREKRQQNVFRILMEEAEIQARLLFTTRSSHLASISEGGDPPTGTLRQFLKEHRPALIDQLKKEGHPELAASYAAAPMPATKLGDLFAGYFGSVPDGRK